MRMSWSSWLERKQRLQKAEQVMSHIKDDNWWKELAMSAAYILPNFFTGMLLTYIFSIKLHIEPPTISVNFAQRANTCPNQVLMISANLHHIYVNICVYDHTTPDATYEDNDHPVTTIIDSIEKHWNKADKALFIACLFLNPFDKASHFNPNNMTVAVLISILC